ncbi:Methyl-CpG-binding domain-containing protein 8 isoform A [Senna tora]|uniref:Methyl-CpG-binding domain-containing protein 8 isoform A n=1 Tax=Senna tora TaxID=362788 RepID=A0A834TWJ4_9FABA|nr:Methyl-CpG-binding domain-containing protein 8 isoform A [Senna tora]
MDGRIWFISAAVAFLPDGHQFVSCKEVSSYLLSCFGLQDINHFKSGHTAGSLQFFGKMEHENPGVGSIATNEMKAVDVASSLFSPSISVFPDHVKQATVSSIGSDENVNNDLASGIKGQGVNNTGGTFANCNHQQSSVVDELPLRADKNGTISVLGCSPEKDRVGNIDNKKLVDDNDVACKLDVPLDVTTSFCNNKNNGNCEIFDEITAVQCLKSAISNFVEDSETIPCGNGESCFKSNGYVEDPQKLIGFERGIFVPNFEGKSCGADKLEEVNISDGNPFENDEWLINSGNCNSETEDVLTSFKLHCSSEGFSVVPSQTELKHASINSMNRIDCLDIDPNVKVSKDVVENFARETISLNEQSLTCKMDNPLSRRFEENLVPPTGDEPLSAFDDNSIMVPSGTLETLKAVESGNKNPQLDIVISNNNAAVDAYSTTSIMQGRSQGCVSEPFSSSIRDKFEEQDHVGVNNADKFCSTEMAKGEQVKIYENDEAFLSFDRNQIESDVNVTNGAWNKI